MKVHYLHLTHKEHGFMETIYDTDEQGLSVATVIEVVAPQMEAKLAEAVGSLPAEREWSVVTVETKVFNGAAYSPPGKAKAGMRLADDGKKKDLI